eukprot:8465612-Pyramimonas_sp.AAC.1
MRRPRAMKGRLAAKRLSAERERTRAAGWVNWAARRIFSRARDALYDSIEELRVSRLSDACARRGFQGRPARAAREI